MSGLNVDIRMTLGGFRLEFEHRFEFGGITALFGPSGSGKSTLLRVISGLERGALGSVGFDGSRCNLLQYATVRNPLWRVSFCPGVAGQCRALASRGWVDR